MAVTAFQSEQVQWLLTLPAMSPPQPQPTLRIQNRLLPVGTAVAEGFILLFRNVYLGAIASFMGC